MLERLKDWLVRLKKFKLKKPPIDPPKPVKPKQEDK